MQFNFTFSNLEWRWSVLLFSTISIVAGAAAGAAGSAYFFRNSALQKKIADLQKDIKAKSENEKTLSDKIKSLESKIIKYKTAVHDSNDEINKLKARRAILKTPKTIGINSASKTLWCPWGKPYPCVVTVSVAGKEGRITYTFKISTDSALLVHLSPKYNEYSFTFHSHVYKLSIKPDHDDDYSSAILSITRPSKQ